MPVPSDHVPYSVLARAAVHGGADLVLVAHGIVRENMMHDDVVILLDDHLRRLEAVRRTLCASRRVTWGERGAALAESVAASRHYLATAAVLLAQIGDAPAPQPPP